MRRPPYMGLAILAGVILIISIAAFRRYLPYVGTSLTPRKPPAIVLAMENAYFVGLGKKGTKAWSLKARKVEIGRDRSITTLTDVSDGKIYDDGKVALKVKAGKAAYDARQESLQLFGGMTVEGRNNEKATADGATWNSSTSTLRSRGQVHFQSTWSKAVTDELFVDLKKKEMTMSNVNFSIDMKRLENGGPWEAGSNETH